MSIYLVQHGLSNPKETDPDQKLSEHGIADVTRIAGVAKGYSVPVTKIYHSGKDRARMTAEIFEAMLAPSQGILTLEGLGPKDDIRTFAGTLDHASNIMYVGHLPFMQKLTSFLVSGLEDITVFRFQNGGIVCLDRDNDAKLWYIRWTLMPRIV